MIPCSWNPSEFLPVFIFTNSLFLSTWIVAKFIWWPMVKKYESEEPLPPLPYADRWPLCEITEETEQLEELKQNVIMEHTSNGPIFMRYNHEQEGFDYWSNDDIEYAELNATARKYALMYQCRNAYTETDEKIIDPSNNESKVDDDDVFLKPKNVKKARRIRMGNKFMHKGKCYESPFFKKEEETKNLFFCGGNVSGLNYKAFKDSFLK